MLTVQEGSLSLVLVSKTNKVNTGSPKNSPVSWVVGQLFKTKTFWVISSPFFWNPAFYNLNRSLDLTMIPPSHG